MEYIIQSNYLNETNYKCVNFSGSRKYFYSKPEANN